MTDQSRHGTDKDVTTDPRLADPDNAAPEETADWTSEGGATPEGPATHIEGGRPDDGGTEEGRG